jgi:hypothetical protein
VSAQTQVSAPPFFPDSQISHCFFSLETIVGSNVIVAGTAIFNDPQPEKVIATLKETVETAQAKLAASKA